MTKTEIDWEERLWQLTSLISSQHTENWMKESEIKEATLKAARVANVIMDTYRGRQA